MAVRKAREDAEAAKVEAERYRKELEKLKERGQTQSGNIS
jgi:hypothetical protein